MVHVFLHEPAIAGNTGNAIRLAAVTGARLHLIEPLGFDLEDAKLRRAGLDYHDLADVSIHPDFEHALAAVPGARVLAFTARSETTLGEVEYRREDPNHPHKPSPHLPPIHKNIKSKNPY
jgi:tRNA (cytidine/uridine-2'-O-)-methyltransferase